MFFIRTSVSAPSRRTTNGTYTHYYNDVSFTRYYTAISRISNQKNSLWDILH